MDFPETKPDQEFTGQLKFLDHLGKIIPANRSLVAELSDVLDISNDSAYRRLRGETQLTYDEISLICNRYNISFDALNQNSLDVVSFWYLGLGESQEDFVRYFNTLKEDLRNSLITKAEHAHLNYAAQGIPIFHYFRFPTLTAFKMHYWMRTILNVPELQGRNFEIEDLDPGLIDGATSFFDAYQKINSTEVWTDTTVAGVIQQIRFYWDSGVFTGAKQALQVCEELRTMVAEIEEKAGNGHKYTLTTAGNKEKGGTFRFYFSEVEFENNCILLEAGDVRTVYLGHLSFRSIKTKHRKYTDETARWLDNLKSKSHLLSGASETTRYKFFARCRKKIDQLVTQIESE